MNTVKELLGEELYEKVREKLGDDRGLIIDDGMLIPKHRFDCINISLREHKKLAADLRGENAELRQRAERADELERKCAGLERELRIAELIARSKPKNYDAVRSNIQAGEFTGKRLDAVVKRRLTELKKSDPYLFFGERLYWLVPVDESAISEIEQ